VGELEMGVLHETGPASTTYRILVNGGDGALNSDEAERFSAVAKVFDQVMFAFSYNEAGMHDWFKTSNAMLLHRRPIDLPFSHESLDEVNILLERFTDGDLS
jgi:uncharacterized protein (DUF2384 family)